MYAQFGCMDFSIFAEFGYKDFCICAEFGYIDFSIFTEFGFIDLSDSHQEYRVIIKEMMVYDVISS
jgi:hypothetical protein